MPILSLKTGAPKQLQYYLEKEIIMKISTISIAEYCVRGKLSDLPLKNVQIVPFNLDHAQRAGQFARVLFAARKATDKRLHPRAIIPNDSKLFAQASLDPLITHFVTSDRRSMNALAQLAKHVAPGFDIIDIKIPYHKTYGLLDL